MLQESLLPLLADPGDGIEDGPDGCLGAAFSVKGDGVAMGFIPYPLKEKEQFLFSAETDGIGSSGLVNFVPILPLLFILFWQCR